jgi:hypothetical protein
MGALAAVLLFGLLAVTGPVWAAEYTIETFECSAAKPGTTIATGINENDEVCGYYTGSDGYQHGFVRNADTGGECTEIFGPNGATTQVLGINNSGDVVGIYYIPSPQTTGGFIKSAADGSLTTFQVWYTFPGQSMDFYTMGINDNGQVAGTLEDNNGGRVHGFIRDADGTINKFDHPSAGTNGQTYAGGINNLGEVTGVYYNANTQETYCYWRSSDGSEYTPVSTTDSNAVWAYGINETAQVAGTLYFYNGIDHGGDYAFVISPNGDYSKFYYTEEGDLGGTCGLAINNSGKVAGFIDISQTQGNDHWVGFIATPITSEPVIDKPVSNVITTTTATLGATIESNGGHAITTAGILYGTLSNPATSGKKLTTTKKSGAFTVQAAKLASNTVYYFCGFATNSAQETGDTSVVSFTTIAGAPTATAPSSPVPSGFTANWTPPPGPATITGYQLDVATNQSFSSSVSGYKNLAVSGANTSVQVKGLTSGQTYYYRVRAVNAGGTSANSNTVKATFEGPLTVSLTSPSSGEKFSGGGNCSISWTYTGTPEPVNIDLLLNSQSALSIKSNESVGAKGKGSYSWTIPVTQTPGTTYQIQVSETSGTPLATSADFEIDAPTISVTSPTAGAKYAPGAKCPISWTYTGNPGNVEIDLVHGGSTALVIQSSASEGTKGKGSYSWIIPKTQTQESGYTIEVKSAASSAIAGAGGTFSITK